MIIHLVGQPASGKTHLAGRLASDLGLPAFSIDDERRKVLRSGEWWPSDDDEAWLALGARVEDAGDCIVETSGTTTNDAVVLRGAEIVTILCRAPRETRLERLRERMKRPFLLLGRPSPTFVDRLLNSEEAKRPSDATWNGREVEYAPLLTQCREALNG